jgi:hypothetical protein
MNNLAPELLDAQIDPEVVDRPASEKRGVPSWLLKPGG